MQSFFYLLIIFVLTSDKQNNFLGKSASEATEDGLRAMLQKFGNTAGAITLSNRGDVGVAFTADRMSWAYQRGGRVYCGISKDDCFSEDA
jgi:beta-aspartyl-peptidase (threonine type)